MERTELEFMELEGLMELDRRMDFLRVERREMDSSGVKRVASKGSTRVRASIPALVRGLHPRVYLDVGRGI